MRTCFWPLLLLVAAALPVSAQETRAGGRRTIQLRLDCQNLFNYAAYGTPVTDPTNTNFGKVVAAVSAAGAMRFFSGGVRFTF